MLEIVLTQSHIEKKRELHKTVNLHGNMKAGQFYDLFSQDLKGRTS
jgi:hypothetical protein